MSSAGVGRVDRSSDSDPRVAMNIDVMSYLAAVLPANEEELVPGVAQIVCRDVADCCAIAVLSDDGRRLHPLGLHHRRLEMLAELEIQPGLAWEPAGGLSERALQTGEPVLTTDADWETLARGRPRVRQFLEWLELGSGIVAGMRTGGAPLGVVSLGRSRGTPPFADDDMPHIQALADELSLALSNVRLRRRLDGPASPTEPGQDVLGTLTERELQILHLIGEGLTNREVAERLFLSIRTIEWHRSNLSAKLGVRQRSELIARGRQLVPEPIQAIGERQAASETSAQTS